MILSKKILKFDEKGCQWQPFDQTFEFTGFNRQLNASAYSAAMGRNAHNFSLRFELYGAAGDVKVDFDANQISCPLLSVGFKKQAGSTDVQRDCV